MRRRGMRKVLEEDRLRRLIAPGHGGRRLVAAFDRAAESPAFGERDEQVPVAFAARAAIAVGQHRPAERLG